MLPVKPFSDTEVPDTVVAGAGEGLDVKVIPLPCNDVAPVLEVTFCATVNAPVAFTVALPAMMPETESTVPTVNAEDEVSEKAAELLARPETVPMALDAFVRVTAPVPELVSAFRDDTVTGAVCVMALWLIRLSADALVGEMLPPELPMAMPPL